MGFVIVRSYEAGVFFGQIVNCEDTTEGKQRVTLNGSRRLWKWHAAQGVALSGVAAHGLKIEQSKVDCAVDGHVISGVIEIIPATAKCVESINAIK